jgi:hypothetical protein
VSGVSGVRCPVSGVRCPVSGVRCPVSGVRCPVSGGGLQIRRSTGHSVGPDDLSRRRATSSPRRYCTAAEDQAHLRLTPRDRA